MDKKALINSGRLQFPKNDRTDKNFIAQPKINLQSFKSTPDRLKQRFTAFGRKPSLGAPVLSLVTRNGTIGLSCNCFTPQRCYS